MTHLQDLIRRLPALEVVESSVLQAFTTLRDAVTAGGKILTCGNGGSASDADHIVGELMKGFLLGRQPDEALRDAFEKCLPGEGAALAGRLQLGIPAVSLCGANALATAVANDMDGELVFAQQVFGLGQPGDVLIAISTSGNSRNVLAAAKTARALGVAVIGLTGRAGGKLAPLCDVAIRVPADQVAAIQEFHLPIYHALCAQLEHHFFAQGTGQAPRPLPVANAPAAKTLPRPPALIVFDFDGVFTDNTVLTRQDGTETVVCDRRDGLGIDMLRDAGVPMMILSKESNPVVQARAAKLKLEVRGGCDDKGPFLTALLAERGIESDRVIYVGNDINDLDAMSRVGFAVAPRDSHPHVLRIADLVLAAPGGKGAVRELAELILSSNEGD